MSPWSLCVMCGSLSCPWGNGNVIKPFVKSYMIINPGPKSPFPLVPRTRILSTSLKKPMWTAIYIDGWCLSYG